MAAEEAGTLLAEKQAQADVEKAKANELFKGRHYGAAEEGYTKAIELCPSAVLLSNRAACYIKLEQYGGALADATAAIELDPTYIKAYYRRGDACAGLGKFKEALKWLKTAAKVAPNDPDLRRKLALCEKEVKRLKFEEALATPDAEVTLVSSTVDMDAMIIEDTYKGPSMETGEDGRYKITLSFIKAMMEEFREQRLVHRRFAFEIVLQAQEHLKELPSLVDVPVPSGHHITVCGDVHGQYYDLLRIFELNGIPAEDNPYLFNGDFVDRGSFSVEVILTLLAFKLLLPNHMHMTRGNHETKAMNKMYGFDGEVRAKYNATLAEVFRETFCWLPLGYVLANKVLVVHGGLFSNDDVTLDDLRRIDRFREPPEDGPFCEVLWSDPSHLPGRTTSKRGTGVAFGADVTRNFLDRNGLELIVRSHEVKEEGYEVEHGGRLITVFSAPNYCDTMGNKGAFIRFNGDDMVPHFTTFEAAPHPNVRPMAYASSLFGFM